MNADGRGFLTTKDTKRVESIHKPYPEYKDSGVEWLGEIPAHWEVSRLRHLCILNPSKSELNEVPTNTEVSFLPMELIGEDGELALEETRIIEDVCEGYTYFRDGDVIVAKITPCFENGKGAICEGLVGGVGFGTTELHVLRPKPQAASRFIFHLTKSDPFLALGKASMYGAAGQQRVSVDFVLNFEAPSPPLPEQQAIAAHLARETARIDSLVAKQGCLIELLQEKRSALISHAVTKGLDPDVEMKDSGVEWLGEIPAGWKIALLKRAFDVQLGKMLQSEPSNSTDTLEPYLRAANVFWNGADLTDVKEMWFSPHEKQQYALVAGDLLVSEGGDVGRSALWKGELERCYIQNAINRVRSKGTHSTHFLYYWVYTLKHSGHIDMLCNKATIFHFTAEKVEAVEVLLPSPSEQRAIAAYLDRETARIDALIAKVREAIERLREYRTALISAAVTGKIDVREEEAVLE